MTTPKRGRPPGTTTDNPRRNHLDIRLTDDEMAQVRADAAEAQLDVSKYVRGELGLES